MGPPDTERRAGHGNEKEDNSPLRASDDITSLFCSVGVCKLPKLLITFSMENPMEKALDHPEYVLGAVAVVVLAIVVIVLVVRKISVANGSTASTSKKYQNISTGCLDCCAGKKKGHDSVKAESSREISRGSEGSIGKEWQRRPRRIHSVRRSDKDSFSCAVASSSFT